MIVRRGGKPKPVLRLASVNSAEVPPASARQRQDGKDPSMRRRRGKFDPPEGEQERITWYRAQALEMRIGGLPYRDIATRLKIDVATAFSHVQAEMLYLREKTELDARAIRDMELERCDVMIAGLWPKVKKGDPIAVNACIRAIERRAKLLGLDAPVKSEFVGAISAITPEAAAKMSEVDIVEAVRTMMNRIAAATGIHHSLSALPATIDVESGE